MKILFLLLLAVPGGAASADELAHAMQARALIGMEVRGEESEATGRIEDLVVDLRNNSVHYVVLQMAGERLATPLQWLKFPHDEDYAVLAPSSRGAGRIAQQAGMTLARASALLGWEIEDPDGTRLGTLTDLVIDPGSGVVAFAALRSPEAERLVPVPLDALQIRVLRENLMLAADRQALNATDGFTSEELKDGLRDLEFLQQQAAAADRLTPGTDSASASAGATQTARQSGALFRRLDRNGDGMLDRHELDSLHAGHRSGTAVDLDRDQRITPDEFTGVRAE